MKHVTSDQWLVAAIGRLKAAEIKTARLDALILLEDQLPMNRAQILAHPEQPLKTSTVNVLNAQVVRRCTHEPLAYLRGKREFYGREFLIKPGVLVPRPESETMIAQLSVLLQSPSFDEDMAAYRAQPQREQDSHLESIDTRLHAPRITVPVRLVDVGCGSGILGITAKLEHPDLSVTLLDDDARALQVSHLNVVNHSVEVLCTKADLLSDPTSDYDIALCNLPYVPENHPINSEAQHEPQHAIYSGKDGLSAYRQFFANLQYIQRMPLYIITEAFPSQHTALARIAQQAGYTCQLGDDYTQVFKLDRAPAQVSVS